MFEIERKFLVAPDVWHPESDGETVVQGYLPHDRDDFDLRVRRQGTAGALAIKSHAASVTRVDIEFEIPVSVADTLLGLVAEEQLIRKTRYTVSHAGRLWTVDAFQHPNPGLVLAEVELESPEEALDLPSWAGREVTGDRRYYNSHMIADLVAEARCATR
jgi:adenylate cyclase